MRKIFISTTFLFVFVYYSFSQNVEQIDSLFNYHLKSIEDTINKYAVSNDVKVLTYKDDVIFLYVLSDISDFKFEQQGYTHQPMLNRVEWCNIKEWYIKYRRELNWNKIYGLIKNYHSYNNAFKTIDNEDPLSFERYEQISDSIDSERRLLINMNTFIKYP